MLDGLFESICKTLPIPSRWIILSSGEYGKEMGVHDRMREGVGCHFTCNQ